MKIHKLTILARSMYLATVALTTGCGWLFPRPPEPVYTPVVAREEPHGDITDLWAQPQEPASRYLWIMRSSRERTEDGVLIEFDVSILDGQGGRVDYDLQESCAPENDDCAVWSPRVALAEAVPNGCEIRATTVKREVDSRELSVMIVADVSGSMKRHRDELVQTLDIVSRGARERGGRTSIALFDSAWETACEFSDPSCGMDDVNALLARYPWWRGTSLWDASIVGLLHLQTEAETRERILVIVSDGEDSSSVESLEDFVSRALQIGIQPFFIEVDDGPRLSSLYQAAYGSGGDYIDRPTVQNLGRVYAMVDRSVRSHYRVSAQIVGCPVVPADIVSVGVSADLPPSGTAPAQRISADRPFVAVGPPSVCSPDHGSDLAVQFERDMDTAVVDGRLESWLRAVIHRMERFPGWRLELRGEADGVGSQRHNNSLSRRRAMFVETELVSRGAEARRVRLVALGEGKVDTEEIEPDRRRVSFSWRRLPGSELPPGCE